jgi:tetratricopeptide (TPR) repeat protein
MRIIDADSKEYQSELSNGYGWLADANKALGRVDGAIAVRQRQVAYLNRLIAAGNSDVALQQQLIVAHQALGVLFTSRGQVEAGIGEYRLALAKADELLAVEPSNRNWRDLSAAVRLELGRNMLALGRSGDSAQEIATGCRIAADLRARDPNVARWRSLETQCLSVRSRLALATGATAEALTLAQKAVASARFERTGDPVTDRYLLAAAWRLLGDVRKRAGDADGAASAWTDGLSQLPRNVTERPWEMNERAELLRRLGRGNEAGPIASKLAASGYRNKD